MKDALRKIDDSRQKKRLVPYYMVLPGFEAVYTGEKSSPLTESVVANRTLATDESSNVMEKWSTWTWTWPGQEKDWDDEIRYINKMQVNLGPLDDNVRQIRAHIGSLVPCDNGFPVTVDELLIAIGNGELGRPSFHNGCRMGTVWWDVKGTQPFQEESMQAIYEILTGYVAGKSKDYLTKRFPYAKGFINRTYEWLGPVTDLTKLQRLMIERTLLL